MGFYAPRGGAALWDSLLDFSAHGCDPLSRFRSGRQASFTLCAQRFSSPEFISYSSGSYIHC
jgi:hypothetical protein